MKNNLSNPSDCITQAWLSSLTFTAAIWKNHSTLRKLSIMSGAHVCPCSGCLFLKDVMFNRISTLRRELLPSSALNGSAYPDALEHIAWDLALALQDGLEASGLMSTSTHLECCQAIQKNFPNFTRQDANPSTPPHPSGEDGTDIR